MPYITIEQQHIYEPLSVIKVDRWSECVLLTGPNSSLINFSMVCSKALKLCMQSTEMCGTPMCLVVSGYDNVILVRSMLRVGTRVTFFFISADSVRQLIVQSFVLFMSMFFSGT